jgi:hypothetical protein
VVEAFVAWSRGYAALLREEISPARLREKLERSDLMTDARQIFFWEKLERAAECAAIALGGSFAA